MLRCLIGMMLLLGVPVYAATLSISVSDRDHKPVSDAVLTLVRSGQETNSPTESPPTTVGVDRKPVAKIIDQINETFVPYVELFRAGDTVAFRNSDRTRHHVYSFSVIKKFEFVLKPGEASTPLVLDRPGVAAIGCNIHDDMVAYLFVSDAPYLAKSDAAGAVTILNLAAGSYVAKVWHPQLRPGAETTLPVTLSTDGSDQKLEVSLKLGPDPRMRMKMRESY